MIEQIKKYDAGFNENDFYRYAEDLFNGLIKAIMNFNVDLLYEYLDIEIYNKYVEIIENYKKMKIKRIFSDVSYKEKMIQSCSVKDDYIIIKLLIVTKYKDTFLHENGEPVNEVDNGIVEKGHYITFSRNIKEAGSKYIIKEMNVI